VKIAESPDWLKQRLEALGQTPINNVVDATNYVMFELGHPLHAFDFDTLAEKRIVVRRARAGETMKTLDDVERKLSPEICMVADAAQSVGIGGIMGGAATEISLFSTNVLLECAWFEPIALRRNAKTPRRLACAPKPARDSSAAWILNSLKSPRDVAPS
jgi:phenylalanyl-tRNA synthetase beta chain